MESKLIILAALLLAVAVIGTFFTWWQQIASSSGITREFTLFAWSLVVSIVYLLITRAAREWKHRA